MLLQPACRQVVLSCICGTACQTCTHWHLGTELQQGCISLPIGPPSCGLVKWSGPLTQLPHSREQTADQPIALKTPPPPPRRLSLQRSKLHPASLAEQASNVSPKPLCPPHPRQPHTACPKPTSGIPARGVLRLNTQTHRQNTVPGQEAWGPHCPDLMQLVSAPILALADCT